ncbi:hypothetical protein [Acidovorax anthurii]|uniref:Uncharacterized protein n=2 Tax=Paracidovorax anthurii TaxID=78229 RepID=A0A328ZJK5_9BURK|nr:hypothetical protein AX018_100240 [Paracidovorax anthurii]
MTGAQIETKSFKDKAGRKPSPAAAPVVVETDLAPVTQLVAAADARAERVRAIAAQVGYQLPGDATEPDLIQRDIAANMRRSVEACLEVGRGLAALKAACDHGEFGKRLQVLDIDGPVASRFILAASRFSNLPLATNLTKAIGTQSKLFELLVLDAEEVQELAAGGEARGLDADEIAGMTRNELREALKESKAVLAAKDKVLADNATKINEQAQALELARSEKFTPAPGSVARTKAEAVLLKEVFTQSLRINARMRALFGAVDGALSDSGGNASEAVQQAARASVQYLAQQFADIAREFDIAIDLDERIDPPWTAEDEAALQLLAAKNAAEDQAARRPTK